MNWREETCGKCFYWRRAKEGSPEGVCFFNPPVVMMIPEVKMVMHQGSLRQEQQLNMRSVYPSMSESNKACGKFDDSDGTITSRFTIGNKLPA